MTEDDMATAAGLLHGAWDSGMAIGALPDSCQPATAAEALAIQDLVVAQSGQAVAGWKILTLPDGTPTWGAIYARDVMGSPATISLADYPFAGVEVEIAYRFRADLPAGAALDPAALAGLMQPLAVIELVDTRFTDYRATPALHRLADRMASGGLIVGPDLDAGREALAGATVRLERDGDVLVDVKASHSRGDPWLPLSEFVAARHPTLDFRAGQIVTTGSLSGLVNGKAGQRFVAEVLGARVELGIG